MVIQNNYIIDLNSEDAFRTLYKENVGYLCHYAESILKNSQLAEDVVDEFFMAIWEKREILRIEKNYKSYFLRSIHNKCLDHLKRKRNKLELYIESLADPKDLTITSKLYEESDVLEVQEIRKVINDSIASLPNACRRIFEMSRFQNKKHKEIAKELDVSVNTVEMQIGRALKKIRIKLKEYMSILV